ncbi:MAG: hypothetical protein CSA65_01075 [Proteobacteria bacterium]|nr:MAG: hypothetical protein CSA65_01075 [Pseudomonadota bacterium]
MSAQGPQTLPTAVAGETVPTAVVALLAIVGAGLAFAATQLLLAPSPSEKASLSAQRPATTPAAGTTPAVGKPAIGKAPAVGRPGVEKPAVEKPAIGKAPAVGKPAVEKPAIGKAPAVGRPAVGRPAVGRPAVGRPAVGTESVGRPAVGTESVGRPAVGRPAVGRPAVGTEPVATKPCAPVFGVAFAAGSTTPRDTIARPAKALATWMRGHPKAKLEIRGHADASGPEYSNFLLSKRRAVAVLKILGRQGLPAKRARVRAFGEFAPLSDNAASNRRVLLSVIGHPACATNRKDAR